MWLSTLLLVLLAFDVRHSAGNAAVLAALRQIAERGARQVDQQEVAAFLVCCQDGAIVCVMWPRTASRRSEHYQGSIPPGTLAIAHTHPSFAERPSRGDVEQAKKIGLPIYVVTRWNLYVVDADGSVIALVTHKNWSHPS